jgi:Fe-S cluster biogenesis protein NfuA
MINTGQLPDDEGLYTLVWTLSEEVSVLKEEIAQALEEVRPHLQVDGGDVELVDVEDGVVKVRLKGACAGCPMSQMTLKWGVENYLKKKVPGVKSVEAVQD